MWEMGLSWFYLNKIVSVTVLVRFTVPVGEAEQGMVGGEQADGGLGGASQVVYRVLLAGLPKAGAYAKQLVPLGVCAGEVGDWTPGASGVDGAVEEAASRVCPGHVPANL